MRRARAFGMVVLAWYLAVPFFSHAEEPVLIPLCVRPEQGILNARGAALSRDGRYVAFELRSVSFGNDDDFTKGVCLFDRKKGVSEWIDDGGKLGFAGMPSLNGNGRDVAYITYSTSVVADIRAYTRRPYLFSKDQIPGRVSNIYVYDSRRKIHHLITKKADGLPQEGEALSPVLTPDSRYVLYSSNSNDAVSARWPVRQIFFYDRLKDQFELISKSSESLPGNRPAGVAKMSRDGRFIAFSSQATNLSSGTAGDSLAYHLYFIDRKKRAVTRIDEERVGFPAASQAGEFDMDGSGRWVVFEGWRRNIRDEDHVLTTGEIFLFDREAVNVSPLLTGWGEGSAREPSISDDGAKIVFSVGISTSDPRLSDLMVYDRTAQSLKKAARGVMEKPAITRDGRLIAFEGEMKEGVRIMLVKNPFID